MSMFLRMGEELDDWRLRSGVAFPLRYRRSLGLSSGCGRVRETADPDILVSVPTGDCGLPPERVFAGVLDRLEGFVDGEPPPLFFRSYPGLAEARESEEGGADGNEAIGGPRGRASRTALMSSGIEMLWTTLTAGHSAAVMVEYSVGKGARQQPGQPGLL